MDVERAHMEYLVRAAYVVGVFVLLSGCVRVFFHDVVTK
jgi:hypothetical protein